MGNGSSICNSFPDCCDGFNFVADEDINATFALTHWYCYPTGIPPWYDNSTQTVNETRLNDYLAVHNIQSFNYTTVNFTDSNFTNTVSTELPFGLNLTEVAQLEKINFIDKKLAWKYETVDVPKLIVSISGIMSISLALISLLVYLGVVIYQPNLYILIMFLII